MPIYKTAHSVVVVVVACEQGQGRFLTSQKFECRIFFLLTQLFHYVLKNKSNR